MSDYTNSYGGAAKDAANATILGADFDTEFDAIATMSGTKANKILTPTLDNLVTMTASGDMKDSGSSIVAVQQVTYPVGSIYMATVATDPNTLLGFGTWQRIAEGRCLIGEGTGVGLSARAAGAELGAESGAATVPEHNHTITDPGHFHTDIGIQLGDADGSPSGQGWAGSHNTGTSTTGITVDNEGGTSDTNMQPSLVVYIWERTA